jgi:hypothetical protein
MKEGVKEEEESRKKWGENKNINLMVRVIGGDHNDHIDQVIGHW